MMQNQGPYPPHYGHGAVPLMAQTSPADRGGQDTLPHPGPLYCPPGPQLGGYAPGVDLMSPTQRVHPVLPPPGQQMNYLHSSPLMYGNYEQFLHQQHTPSTPSHIAMPPIFSPEPPHFTTSGGGYNYSDPRLMSSQAASSIYTSPPGSLPSFQSLQVQTAMSHPALSSSSSQPLPYGFGSPHYSGYHPASSLALPTTPAIAKETVEQQQQPPHRATANTTDLFEFIMKPSSSVATSTITTTTTTLASSSSVLQTAATVSNSRPAVVSSSSLTQPTQSGTNDGPSTLYADPNSSQLGSKAIHTTSEPPPLPPQDRINTLSPASSGMTSPPYSTTSGSSLLAPQLHGSYEPLPPPPPTSHQNHQLCLSSSGMGNYGSIAAVSPDLDDRVSAFEKALLNFQHMELSAVPPQSLARYGIIEEPQLVGDKFFCKKCNYYTTRVDKVLQHLKAHRGNITCDICGKAFLKRADKVRHMVCHTSPSLRGPKVMKGACSSSAATDVNNHSSSVLPPSDSHSRLFSSSSPQHQLQKNEDLQHGNLGIDLTASTGSERHAGMIVNNSSDSEAFLGGMRIVAVQSLGVQSMWDNTTSSGTVSTNRNVNIDRSINNNDNNHMHASSSCSSINNSAPTNTNSSPALFIGASGSMWPEEESHNALGSGMLHDAQMETSGGEGKKEPEQHHNLASRRGALMIDTPSSRKINKNSRRSSNSNNTPPLALTTSQLEDSGSAGGESSITTGSVLCSSGSDNNSKHTSSHGTASTGSGVFSSSGITVDRRTCTSTTDPQCTTHPQCTSSLTFSGISNTAITKAVVSHTHHQTPQLTRQLQGSKYSTAMSSYNTYPVTGHSDTRENDRASTTNTQLERSQLEENTEAWRNRKRNNGGMERVVDTNQASEIRNSEVSNMAHDDFSVFKLNKKQRKHQHHKTVLEDNSSEREDNNNIQNGHPRHRGATGVKLWVGDDAASEGEEGGGCNEIILLDESLEENGSELCGSAAVVVKEEAEEKEEDGYGGENRSQEDEDGEDCIDGSHNAKRDRNRRRNSVLNNSDTENSGGRTHSARSNMNKVSSLRQLEGRNEEDNAGSNREEDDEQYSDYRVTSDMPTLPDAIETVAGINGRSDSIDSGDLLEVKRYKTPIFQYEGSRSSRVRNSGANTVNPSFPEPQAIEQAMTKGPRMQDFNINSLRCIYCSYTGSSPRHLAKHYKAHATSYKICRFCNKAFERPSDLVRHEQRHIRNQTIFGSEDIRSTRTGQDTSEVKSIFMRPPITNKRNVLHCRRCGFATTDQHMLNRHLAKSHKQQIFSCEFCTHKFLSEVALYNHIVDCHSAPNAEINVTSKLKKTLKYWTCSICEKTCITRKELAMHFSMAHSNMQGSEFATASKPNSPNKEVDFTSDRATWQSIQQRRIEYSPYVYQPPGVYHMPANYEWREGHIQESMAPGLPYGEGGEEAAMSMKMEESLNDSEDLRVGEYRSAEQGGRKRRKSVQSHREDVNEEYSTEFSMAHPSESADGLIDEASSKKSYTNLIGKIRKQVEYQIRQEKSRDSISRECIECPVCGKDFDSFPVCNIHQLVSHSMCSIRVDRYRNNILTGTDLMKAEVVGENEVSLFVDTREKFADASGYKEVPTVSSVQDAKLIGTNIVKSKENSGTKEPQAEQFESDDDNTMDVYSSTEAKQDSLQQTEEPSKNSVGSSEESSKELSYFFNITPDSNVATSTTSKVSASSSHTSVTDGSPDVRVSSITSTAPSTSIQQTSQTRPDVIKPQTISAIAAEVQQINAQIKAVREKEKSPKNAGKQSVETESCKAASKEDGSSKKAIVVSSGQTSATFRKKFSCNPGSAHNLDDLDPDSIVEKLLKKYAKETDQQNQQRPMILQKVSNSSGRSHEVMKFKSAVAPHIRDHSYVTSVSGSLLKSAIKHSISVNKIKNTPQSRAYANKRRTIANSTLAEDIPMIMPTISSVVSLSPEVTGIYPTAPPTDSDASNALPVLNSITDINEFNPDYGVPPLQIQELKIVGSPILNTNMRQQESSYIQPQQVDWTTERDSAKRKIKCKPGPTKYAAFRCHRCSYGTNALHKYRQHEQAHEHAKFVCKVCDKACIKSCDLVRHWVAHNIKTPNGGFKCDSCEFSDADKEILERHMLCHYYVNKRPPWELNNSDPSTYEPIIDGKRWLSQRGNRRPGGRSRKKLRGHYSVSSSSSASTRGQALESAMEEPVKKVPKQLSPVKEMCKVCKKLIPRLLMPYHIREEHDREKNTSHVRTRHRSKYYCPKCGLGFTDSDAMFVHSFLEHDSSDFEPNEDTTGGGAGHDGNQWDSPETDTIKNQFENTKNDDMQGSTSSINEESQFMCTQCNETFVTYYFLDKHRRNVHWKIENKQEIPSSSRHDITCPICFKALSRSYLKDHMRLHTGEKPHQCPKCSASFAMLQYLQLHLLKKHKCRLNRRQLQSPPPAKSQRQSAAGDDRAETELPMATDASEDFENSTVTEDQVDDLSNQNYDTGQDSKSPGPTSAAAVVKVLTADDGEAEMAAESSKKKRRVESEVDTSATEDIENNDEGS